MSRLEKVTKLVLSALKELGFKARQHSGDFVRILRVDELGKVLFTEAPEILRLNKTYPILSTDIGLVETQKMKYLFLVYKDKVYYHKVKNNKIPVESYGEYGGYRCCQVKVDKFKEVELDDKISENSKNVISNNDISKSGIVHLHLHTDYSLQDGTTNVEKYLDKAKELGMKAMAVTEHGNMSSSMYFYQEAMARGIKPIMGVEQYVVDSLEKKKESKSSNHLVLLARNESGLHNLYKIQKIAWTEGFYYRPRVDLEILEKYNEGIMCLTACLKGHISADILNQDLKTAYKKAERLKSIYGSDLYLELQTIDVIKDGVNYQELLNVALIEISKKYDIKLVVTNDVHYVNPDDWRIQAKVSMINRDSEKYAEDMCKENWFKNREQILEAAKKHHPSIDIKYFKQGLDNTLEIAGKVEENLIKMGEFITPKFNWKKHPEYNGEPTIADFFSNYCWKLFRKFKDEVKPDNIYEYKERLKHEINIMTQVQVLNYTLIVEDLIRYARDKGTIAQTRGSVNGSFVCYLFGFNAIDPVKWGISFERFLSVARLHTGKKDADIDIDFESEFRGRAVNYLLDRFGTDKVCSVGSFSRTQLKGAIKAVGRVEEEKFKRLTERDGKYKSKLENFSFRTINLVTRKLYGDETIEDLLTHEDKKIKDWAKENEKWLRTYISPIIGNVATPSVHPAGICITPEPLETFIPVKTQKYKEGRVIVTQWENGHTGREDLNARGVAVIDVLGVKTLSIIHKTIKLIERKYGTRIDMRTLPLDDKLVYRAFSRGQNECIFQLNSRKLKEMLRHVKPTNFEDIIALNAINRPGPLSAGADKHYGDRKNGRERVSYPHESIRGVLKDTYGIPIYSEHLMGITTDFAKMSAVDAEKLRKLVKAKDTDTFKQFGDKFIESAVKAGRPRELAIKVWDLLGGFGSYAFPKGHAAAYALIGYTTQYLKVHYPAEFFASYLQYADDAEYGELKAVAKKYHKVGFLYPSINKSKPSFSVAYGKKKNSIRMGLSNIKSVGDKAAQAIKKIQPVKNMQDFWDRVDKRVCNKKVMEKLILSDVFAEFGTQEMILEQYYKLRKAEMPKEYTSLKGFEWTRKKFETLGLPGIDYAKIFSSKLKGCRLVTPVGEIEQVAGVVGQLSKVYQHETKKGKMAFLKLSTAEQEYNVVVWADKWESIGSKPKVGQVVYLYGIYKESRGEMSIFIGEDDKINIIS